MVVAHILRIMIGPEAKMCDTKTRQNLLLVQHLVLYCTHLFVSPSLALDYDYHAPF